MGNAATVIASMTKEQLIFEFATIYNQNPEMWDKVIDDVRSRVVLEGGSETQSNVSQEAAVEEVPEHVIARDSRVEAFTTAMVKEMNQVRTNPKGYVHHLKERLDSFIDDFVYKLSSGEYLRTKDGKKGE